VRLGIALETASGPTLVPGGSYDETSGILSGSISQLGAVAAVISLDALEVDPGTPPTLGGGAFGSAPAGTSGAAGAAGIEAVRFTSSCSPAQRRCFRSGLLKAWISDELRERLGGNIHILSATVTAEMEFDGFDANGEPTLATGRFALRGTLRAGVGRSVNSFEIDRRVATGSDPDAPAETSVSVDGNTLIFASTSDGPGEEIEFSLRRIGTGQLLTVRLEDEVTLENSVGDDTTGTVIIHLRLRR
jgi:hypothetical protein